MGTIKHGLLLLRSCLDMEVILQQEGLRLVYSCFGGYEITVFDGTAWRSIYYTSSLPVAILQFRKLEAHRQSLEEYVKSLPPPTNRVPIPRTYKGKFPSTLLYGFCEGKCCETCTNYCKLRGILVREGLIKDRWC